MRTYETVPTTTQRLKSIRCDWCKQGFKGEYDFSKRRGGYEVNEFELRWKTGDQYPECGSGEEIKVELCHKCRKKFKDEIEKLGIELNETDWDW